MTTWSEYIEEEMGPTILLSERSPIARKSHICDDCGLEIKPGERYYRVAYFFDGEFHFMKAHTSGQWCLDG